MASAETHTEMRPPRYTSERPLEARSCSKDKAALRIARKAFGVLRTRRTNAKQRRDGTDIREAADDVVNSHVEEEKQAGPSEEATTRVPENSSPEPFFYGDNPPIWLGMSSMYDGTGEWPKKKDPEKLAKQYSWSNIGFPRDESLVLSSYEKDTLIDRTMPTVAALTETVRLIRTRPSEKIADGGKAKRSMEGQRIIDDFTMNGSTVTSVRFLDVDIFANSRRETYRTCKTSTEFEKAVTEGICEQPALDVEQWAAAYVLLAKGGDIGGRVNDYWTRARDLARQQLHVKPELEADIRQQMKTATSNDHAFTEMLSVVREAIKIKTANPYFQSRRDAYAVEQGLFHYIDSDITMVFDKHGVVIAFQCSDVFRKLLDGGVQAAVTKDFENFSTRQPVPIPDMTRHGLHYIDWLAERPELDFRNPRNNPRLAKSGVYHFGARCPAGDPTGNQEPDLTKDSGKRVWEDRGVRSQLKTLHFNALGACTELVTFFFDLLDHELLKEYQKVATEVATLDHQPFATRHSGDPFSMRALLINLMTHDHRDESDWKRGFAGLVAVGDFEGGDLLLRQLGLRIKSQAGCVQLFRGRELFHSITKWKGRRFVVVNVTHDAVRQWALRHRGEPVVNSSGTTSTPHCLDAEPEDVIPEQQRILSDRELFPETWVPDPGESDLPDSDASSEAEVSITKAPNPKKGARIESSSDASGEGSPSDSKDTALATRKKKKKQRQT